MRLARGIYSFDLDLRRDFGFVHTSSEALQALRFSRGEMEFPDHVIPIIARDAETQGLLDEPVAEQPDIFLIEISSAKETRVGEYRCQLNYMVRHFADFFADPERRKRFNRLSGPGQWKERQEWLDTLKVYQSMAPEDRELLSATEIRTLGVADMIADLEEIRARTADTPVVIQTHVAARDASGELLATRTRVMGEVKQAAEALGLPVFDPSEEMELFGQAKALNKNGTDLTHFSEVFAEHIGSKIYEDHIRILEIDAEGADVNRAREVRGELAQLNQLIDDGHLLEAAQTVREKLRKNPHAPAFRRVLATVLVETFDFEGALEILDELEAAGTINETESARRLEALLEVGREDEAFVYARKLLKQEYESPKILALALRAASEPDPVFAQEIRKRMLRNGDIDLATANDLLENAPAAEQSELAIHVLEAFPSSMEAFSISWRESSNRDDSETLEKLAAQAGELPIEGKRALVQELMGLDRDLHAAMLVPVGEGEAFLDVVSKKDAMRWGDAGAAAYAAGDQHIAIELIGGAFACYPGLGAAKIPRSAIGKDFGQRFRAAWAEGDYETLLSLTAPADRLQLELPERDKNEGLAAYRSEQPERALEALTRAAQSDAVPKNALFSLVRVARQLRRLETELSGLQRLLDLYGDDDEAVEFIAEKRILSLDHAERVITSPRRYELNEKAAILVALRKSSFIEATELGFLADFEERLCTEFLEATTKFRVATLEAMTGVLDENQPGGSIILAALSDGDIRAFLDWLSHSMREHVKQTSQSPVRLVSNRSL